MVVRIDPAHLTPQILGGCISYPGQMDKLERCAGYVDQEIATGDLALAQAFYDTMAGIIQRRIATEKAEATGQATNGQQTAADERAAAGSG